eukprot:CAMPEP_0198145928 /NCGR_PEP_ID=MMETSP1443-20131203/26228_1 /TAXON_ID=186043 /ORGANISM="Entomoneis sp., Strain CCMP2396" /LENGTH=97 /DNA_ID=CAMNT_0043809693 /DNA_START=146 /DNA_END=437 /DNA_ORIENTATION=-
MLQKRFTRYSKTFRTPCHKYDAYLDWTKLKKEKLEQGEVVEESIRDSNCGVTGDESQKNHKAGGMDNKVPEPSKMVGPALTQSYADIVKGNHTENRG